MARRRWKWLLPAAIALLLVAVWGYDGVLTIHWVGAADLAVEFAVTDAATDSPVPGAWVEVQSEGGLYEEREKLEFVLPAGADGVARRECRGCLCFGTQSGLRLTDTFAVHLPWWRFRAVADGYQPGEWACLDVPEHVGQARPDGPGRARLA